MLRRGVQLGLILLVLSACNFRIEPGWTPPRPGDGGEDGSLARADAGLEAGQALQAWCRDRCAAEGDDETCSQVICADAAVCVDDPPCDRCAVCRDD